ncbi:hypothetical protein PDIDSM_1128 [Penicillium digitatum]|nr:hypothetical protein PDIDSM_1128 [Penicillium digitatum]
METFDISFLTSLTKQMLAHLKENVPASARITDPTQAQQEKDLFDVNFSGSTATRKRKRGGQSSAKRRRTSSSMETISLESTNSKTSHKRLPNKEPKRDDSVTKSGKSRGVQQATSPSRTQPELSPKASSEPKAAMDSVSTKHTKPLELPDLPPSEFIYPRKLDLGILECLSDERETTHESVSDNPSEQLTEVSTPYTPVLHAVSQYNQRIRSHCGANMYDELGDISTRIEKIMHGITVMLEEREARDEFASVGGYSFEAEESPGAFKGGPENPLELSDGDDNALLGRSDERACSGEIGGLSASE